MGTSLTCCGGNLRVKPETDPVEFYSDSGQSFFFSRFSREVSWEGESFYSGLEEIFQAIAKHMEPGYIEFIAGYGEDGPFRIYFDGNGNCQQVNSQVVWPEVNW